MKVKKKSKLQLFITTKENYCSWKKGVALLPMTENIDVKLLLISARKNYQRRETEVKWFIKSLNFVDGVQYTSRHTGRSIFFLQLP